jgi:type IV pilus assembly protein PilQ
MNKTLLAWALSVGTLLLNVAAAAIVTGIQWAPGPAPVLEVHLTGSAKYQVRKLAHGLRLSLTLADSSLGPKVTDLGSNGAVKGVYPYLADGGRGVNIDLLMKAPGTVKVSPATGMLSVAVLSASGAPAVAGATRTGTINELTGISYSPLPGDQVQLHLAMTGPPVAPIAFRIDSPPSIVLDFPHTRLDVAKPQIKVGVGAVVRVVAVAAGNRTRVVLTLVKNARYSTFVGHHSVSLVVQNPEAVIAGATTGPRMVHFATSIKGKHRIMNVNFTRGPEGDGRVTVRLSDPNVGINITRRHGQIIVDFLNTHLPRSLERRLNVADFATPVQTIDTFVRGRNTRMIVRPSGAYEQLAYQTGRKFTVDVKPVSASVTAKRRHKYTGKKISMNFDRISVRSALQVLADFTHLNFVTSNAVHGNLTLRLENVPWDQALAIILDSKDLAMRRVGNVIMVGPEKEMAAQEKAKLEAEQEAAKLQPLESVLIRINYAKAADIAALLKSIKPVNSVPSHFMPFSNVNYSKVATESNSLLSPRGQVTVDPRTNSLLIQDIPSKIRQVRKLIAKLDQPVQQVLIEARLVEATDDFSKSLGVRFGSNITSSNGSTSISQVPNLGGITTTSGLDTFNVDLPSIGSGSIPPGTVGLTIAKLGTSNLLNLEISALQADGKGKIISSPRVITANQEEAKIEQGQQQFFNLGFGQSQIESAVLGLDVTPQVTPDNRVILTVKITDDTFANAVAGTLNTKKITTQVLLDNGQTVVIGGIYTRNKLTSVDKVPVLGDLPLIGWMFRNRAVNNQKDELLIFLTPRILSPSLNLH